MEITRGKLSFLTLDNHEFNPLPKESRKDKYRKPTYTIYKSVTKLRTISNEGHSYDVNEKIILDNPICYLVDRILGLYGSLHRKTLPNPAPKDSTILNRNTSVIKMLNKDFLLRSASKSEDYPLYVNFNDNDLKKGVEIIANEIDNLRGSLESKDYLRVVLLKWLSVVKFYKNSIRMLLVQYRGYDPSVERWMLLSYGIRKTKSWQSIFFLWQYFDKVEGGFIGTSQSKDRYKAMLRDFALSAFMSDSPSQLSAVMAHGFYIDDLKEIISSIGKYGSIDVLEWLIKKYDIFGSEKNSSTSGNTSYETLPYSWEIAFKIFYHACMNGHLTVAQYMVDKGLVKEPELNVNEETDKYFNNFFGQVVATGNLHMVKYLYEDYLKGYKSPDVIKIPLNYLKDVLRDEYYDVFYYLVDTKRIDLNGEDKTLINAVIRYGNYTLFNTLLENEDITGITPENVNDNLVYLVANDKYDILHALYNYWGDLSTVVDINVLKEAIQVSILGDEDWEMFDFLIKHMTAGRKGHKLVEYLGEYFWKRIFDKLEEEENQDTIDMLKKKYGIMA